MQGLSHVVHRNSGQVLTTYRSYGTRQILTLHGTITDHHHFVETDVVFLQFHVDRRLATDTLLSLAETDVVKHEHCLLIRHCDGIITVHVGNHTRVLCTFDGHTHTDERLLAAIGHLTLHRLGLSEGYLSRQHHYSKA